MNNEDLLVTVLEQEKQIRQLKLELEALKRMFFEHRPPFVESFAHQVGAVEASGFLRPLDEIIQRLEQSSKAR
jgi:hypothetical protein